MRWMITAILIAALGLPIAFTAGVVISLNVAAEESPAKTLKDIMGSAGDWVSGLGALAAAAVAVYLADRQRREDLPNIGMSVQGFYEVSLVNYGRLPVEVSGLWLYLTSKYGDFELGHDLDDDRQEKIILGFAETATFRYGDHLMLNAASWAHVKCNRDIGAISLVVPTPVKHFKFPLPEHFAERLNHELNQIRT
ncbi:hypothetical protein N5K35_24220 [Pseudomonas sp. GD03651]|uniref:hypothetical protein n=1 Tax=Pseudomonas TaxID=286 RepID=UPI00034F0835|nr:MULTISPECIES: hypothetical protein [Pseudomonas]AGN82839.1 hypothetical protein L483_20365 [Pseudomonas putida H8234]MDH2186798.1 hypothetical protein [Pseudomonas sp. GD03651]